MNNTIIKILNKLDLLRWINIHGYLRLNNKEFTIPILGKTGHANLFMSEPWMTDLLKIILPIENKTFIDVGVNVGQSLLKLKSISAEINYIGFEPNPICIHYLTKLMKANQFKNTAIIPVGISEKNELGTLHFFYASGADSSASMVADFRPDQKVDRKEFIPLLNLDSLKETIQMDSLSILKIDVEGAELEVINSFKKEINEKSPIILMEILPVYNDKYPNRLERQNQIQTVLRDASYSIYRVKKKDYKLLGFQEIEAIGIQSDLNNCEYVMVPQLKKEKFNSQLQGWLNN